MEVLLTLDVKFFLRDFFTYFFRDSIHARPKQPLQDMELQEKKHKKIKTYTKNLFKKNLQLKNVC